MDKKFNPGAIIILITFLMILMISHNYLPPSIGVLSSRGVLGAIALTLMLITSIAYNGWDTLFTKKYKRHSLYGPVALLGGVYALLYFLDLLPDSIGSVSMRYIGLAVGIIFTIMLLKALEANKKNKS